MKSQQTKTFAQIRRLKPLKVKNNLKNEKFDVKTLKNQKKN